MVAYTAEEAVGRAARAPASRTVEKVVGRTAAGEALGSGIRCRGCAPIGLGLRQEPNHPGIKGEATDNELPGAGSYLRAMGLDDLVPCTFASLVNTGNSSCGTAGQYTVVRYYVVVVVLSTGFPATSHDCSERVGWLQTRRRTRS